MANKYTCECGKELTLIPVNNYDMTAWAGCHVRGNDDCEACPLNDPDKSLDIVNKVFGSYDNKPVIEQSTWERIKLLFRSGIPMILITILKRLTCSHRSYLHSKGNITCKFCGMYFIHERIKWKYLEGHYSKYKPDWSKLFVSQVTPQEPSDGD